MNSVLGFPLETAVALLRSAGYAVETREARCRKGNQGGDLRVLRQTSPDGHRVLLTYAGFTTKPRQ